MAEGKARRALAWAAVAGVFLLMTLGNIVSATGSGLACPDWPLCHGRLVPPLRAEVLIEYGHRLAAVLTSALLVASIVATLRASPAPGVRRMGKLLLWLLAAQIALGGITVRLGLPHLISTAHLVNALLILGGLVALAGRGGSAAVPAVPAVARLARVGLAVLLLQLALGGYVRHTGAGLACPDFPLCSGEVLPGHWLAAAHWVHRWLGLTLLGLFVHLALVGRRTRLGGATAVTAALAAGLVLLGIAAVLFRLEPALRAAHAALGYALWAALVWLGVAAGAWRGLLAGSRSIPEPAPEVAHAS
jgi:heme A synthase